MSRETPQRRSARALARKEPIFRKLQQDYDYPPDFLREAGFETLLRIILEQQVSLASAEAVFLKLKDAEANLTPESFLRWEDDELLGFGFSRQKRAYCRGLALALCQGSFSFGELAKLSDQQALDYLMQLKGIGTWSAQVYLLMAEQRLDVFPDKDLALQVAWQELSEMESRPAADELRLIAEEWIPHRSAAAKWLWHAYLTNRGL